MASHFGITALLANPTSSMRLGFPPPNGNMIKASLQVTLKFGLLTCCKSRHLPEAFWGQESGFPGPHREAKWFEECQGSLGRLPFSAPLGEKKRRQKAPERRNKNGFGVDSTRSGIRSPDYYAFF